MISIDLFNGNGNDNDYDNDNDQDNKNVKDNRYNKHQRRKIGCERAQPLQIIQLYNNVYAMNNVRRPIMETK